MQAGDLELQIVEEAEQTVLVLRNVGEAPVGRNWRLYNSFGVIPLEPGEVESTAVEGRFGFLAPGPAWTDLAPGAALRVVIKPWIFAGNRLIDRQGFQLTTLEGNREVMLGAPSVLPAVLQPRDETPHDFIRAGSPDALTQLMTPERSYERFAATRAHLQAGRAQAGHADVDTQAIIPSPAALTRGAGIWSVGRNSAVDAPEALAAEAAWLRGELAQLEDTPEPAVITLELDASAGEGNRECYELNAGPGAVLACGVDRSGVFYALQSLLQLAGSGPQAAVTVTVTVRDRPGFGFRAVYLDIARHFPGVATIERLLRAMARYKLNVLVLGVSNDEGWRLEIPGVPELTEVGAARRFDPEDHHSALPPALGDAVDSEHAGCLMQDEFVALLRLAAVLHIEPVVEFNLPGHSNALIRALATTGRFTVLDPQDWSSHPSHQGYEHNTVNPCVAGTYEFAKVVIAAIASMYERAGVPFHRLHCGGDETPPGTWLESPACAMTPGWNNGWSGEQNAPEIRTHVMRHHFRELARVAREVEPHLKLGFWHEMAPYVDPGEDGIWFNDWTTHTGHGTRSAMAAGGHPVIISNASYLYFDMPYVFDPDEPGLPWATYIDTRGVLGFAPDAVGGASGQVQGLQAQLWSETVYSPDLVDYYLFPRLLAFAERCWNPAGQGDARAWDAFALAAGCEHEWLERQGIRFRIAPPGVSVRDGIAHALAEFPTLVIRYSSNGEPGPGSPIYGQPLEVGKGLWFSTWSGQRSSRAVFVPG